MDSDVHADDLLNTYISVTIVVKTNNLSGMSGPVGWLKKSRGA
jgi:hypothetical protein